ncbi:MAG: RNA methyltransferase, partial [Kiloniellales bacterium]|nr:RNA methyltransferase [Kiloniellales bacterium]
MAKRKPAGRQSRQKPDQPTAARPPQRPALRPAARPGPAAPKSAAPRSAAPRPAAKPAIKAASGGRYWLYGRHAASAALANPARAVARAIATPEALERLDPTARQSLESRGIPLETASRGALDAALPPGAVHQGLALEVRPLAQLALADWLAKPAAAASDRRALLVALDQVSDPHNVGAVLRSAAAFGARAVLAPRHGQAGESAALAKAASGALDAVPYIDASNLARALALLKKKGFWIMGLAGDAADGLVAADPGGPLVLVLGGEGKGLRRLTREACDLVARLPTRPPIDQLNVS